MLLSDPEVLPKMGQNQGWHSPGSFPSELPWHLSSPAGAASTSLLPLGNRGGWSPK